MFHTFCLFCFTSVFIINMLFLQTLSTTFMSLWRLYQNHTHTPLSFACVCVHVSVGVHTHTRVWVPFKIFNNPTHPYESSSPHPTAPDAPSTLCSGKMETLAVAWMSGLWPRLFSRYSLCFGGSLPFFIWKYSIDISKSSLSTSLSGNIRSPPPLPLISTPCPFPSQTCIQPWCMNYGWLCRSASPSCLNSTYTSHILNSSRAKVVSPIFLYPSPPHPNLLLVPVKSKSFKQICWMMTDFTDWLTGLNETHLHICSPAVKMKYVELIQLHVWKQFLSDASCQALLFMVMSEIKSSIQPFETSTLEFNLHAGSFPFAPVDPISTLCCPALCLVFRRLNTRKSITQAVLPCSLQLMDSPRGGTGGTPEGRRRERPGYSSPSLTYWNTLGQ